MGKRLGGKELWGLLVLFAVLIGLAAYYEQVGQEKVSLNSPSVNNSQKEGVRALYLLYRREGFHAEELKSPWSDLSVNDRLLVFVEPPDPDRPITLNDMKALENWIREGGTLLDLVSFPPVEQPLDPNNAITGDCGATAGPGDKHEVPVASNSPLTKDVSTLSVQSTQRLTLATNAPYTVMARDSAGILAAAKLLGKGKVILIANRYGATNEGIREADNSILLYNIAKETVGNTTQTIQFDEYHHGVGFDQRTASGEGGLWESTPIALRLVCFHILGLGLLLLYNSNRRFGPARYVPPVTFRSSTDYVNSMARLYRRAGASDIAIEILYHRFLRDLKRALDTPNETGAAQVVRLAEQKFGPHAAGLQAVLMHGEAVLAGTRLHEKDMLHLARQIEHFRRSFQLVGV